MPGKCNAGIVDDAFVHGCSGHGVKAAAHAAVDRDLERAQHIARVGAIKAARGHRGRQWHIDHRQRAWREGGRRSGCEGQGAPRQPELSRALLKQTGICDHHQIFGLRPLREQHAQVRADAGGFAGGDGDDGPVGCWAVSDGCPRCALEGAG